MKVVLLTHTPDPDVVIATAAHQCVSNDDTEEYAGKLAKRHPRYSHQVIAKALSYGHTSILEHASFTFAISSVSRSLSHQLVRFRIASFSQQSQRYVKGPFDYVIPPSIEKASLICDAFERKMEELNDFYTWLINNDVPAEDARFVLPNACETSLIMTMNARELLHAFTLRCCEHAQWEIRELFWEILKIVTPILRVAFNDAGPACFRGKCPEGARSCGGSKHVRET